MADQAPRAEDILLTQQARDILEMLSTILQAITKRHKLKAEDEPEVSEQQMRALGLLSKRGPISMSAFAEALDIPFSTATHIVDRLVSKGLVERYRPESDRRLVEVKLSGEGERHDRIFRNQQLAVTTSMLEGLSPGERALYIELLGKMAKAVTPEME